MYCKNWFHLQLDKKENGLTNPFNWINQLINHMNDSFIHLFISDKGDENTGVGGSFWTNQTYIKTLEMTWEDKSSPTESFMGSMVSLTGVMHLTQAVCAAQWGSETSVAATAALGIHP